MKYLTKVLLLSTILVFTLSCKQQQPLKNNVVAECMIIRISEIVIDTNHLEEYKSILKEEAEAICGKPQNIELDDELVAAIKWVDGTVIDAVRKVPV